MKKVLVLDDDLDILKLVQTILSINNFKAETISQWQKLYPAIESFDPDLILLDISLGDGDGIEICKQLKQNPATTHIPVVLFSANVEMGKKINECGAQGYLAKPFAVKDLVHTINSSLS